MNQVQALEHAKKVVNLLNQGTQWVGNTSIGGQNLMGTLSIMAAGTSHDSEALNPYFQEIIVFGSTAKDESFPKDVDMMVFDRGFYSNIFLADQRASVYGMSDGVRGNLLKLLTGWFDFSGNEDEVQEAVFGRRVDLLVLPVSIFTDRRKRREVAQKQYDPEFFRKAFSKMFRFDPVQQEFVRIDLSYFEQKYGGDLSELRNETVTAD